MFTVKGTYQATIELDIDDIIEKEDVHREDDLEIVEDKVRNYMSDHCFCDDDPSEDDWCVNYFADCVIARLNNAIH